ncbi:DUF7014 domain-containing protein [Deinococcus wulumuqiensis]|uniref:DUF7014 domain-containing protein n=1 Tax=Deinococcus wulumuqiensis TaxID=980427 RepID=UPI003B96B80A
MAQCGHCTPSGHLSSRTTEKHFSSSRRRIRFNTASILLKSLQLPGIRDEPTICSKRGWEFDSRDTASRLVKIVIEKGLLPTWQEENLTGIRLTLESIATPRNKMGGHGQGTTVVSAPEFYARYALNITASAIVLLIEADAALT